MTFESWLIPEVKQREPGGDSDSGKQIVRSITLFIFPLSIISSVNSRRQISVSVSVLGHIFEQKFFLTHPLLRLLPENNHRDLSLSSYTTLKLSLFEQHLFEVTNQKLSMIVATKSLAHDRIQGSKVGLSLTVLPDKNESITT